MRGFEFASSVAQPPAQDFHQTIERAAAAADPPAAGIGDHDRLANIAEQTQLAAQVQLRLVSLRLPLIRGRDDQDIPGTVLICVPEGVI